MKVLLESEVFGFSDVLPIRELAITFPTPTDPRYDLILSHEIDDPWSTFEFWFPTFELPNFELPGIGFEIPPFGIPGFPPFNPCEPGGCVDTFERNTPPGPNFGTSEILGYSWGPLSGPLDNQSVVGSRAHVTSAGTAFPERATLLTGGEHSEWDNEVELLVEVEIERLVNDEEGSLRIEKRNGPETDSYVELAPQTDGSLDLVLGTDGTEDTYSVRASAITWDKVPFYIRATWDATLGALRVKFWNSEVIPFTNPPQYDDEPDFTFSKSIAGMTFDNYQPSMRFVNSGAHTFRYFIRTFEIVSGHIPCVVGVQAGILSTGLVETFTREEDPDEWGISEMDGAEWDLTLVDATTWVDGARAVMASTAGVGFSSVSGSFTPVTPVLPATAGGTIEWGDTMTSASIALGSGGAEVQLARNPDTGMVRVTLDAGFADETFELGVMGGTGVWHMKIYIDSALARGKAWQDGEEEPGYQVAIPSSYMAPAVYSYNANPRGTGGLEPESIVYWHEVYAGDVDPCRDHGPALVDPPTSGPVEGNTNGIPTPAGEDPTSTWFITSHQFYRGSEAVYLNGIFLRPGSDYIAHPTDRWIEILSSVTVDPGDQVYVTYEIYLPGPETVF